jgi:hypothetical protein
MVEAMAGLDAAERDEVTALTARLESKQRTFGIIPGPGRYKTCDMQAYTDLHSRTEAITTGDLRHLLQLGTKRIAVEQLVRDHLIEHQLEHLDGKVAASLDWLCGRDQDRAQMMAWRDEIALGRQSVARFVAEIKNPTMSHSPHNCRAGCGLTPALACTQGRCGRCCSRSGCPRHPNDGGGRRDGGDWGGGRGRSWYGGGGGYDSDGYDSDGYDSDGYDDGW